MTESTVINKYQNDVLDCLKKIDNEYSLFSYRSERSVDEHIDCLLEIFRREFMIFGASIGKCDAWPIKAVLPLFYQLDEWSSWNTKEIKYYKYISSIGSLEQRLSIQSQLSKKTKISFSKSILKLQNEAEDESKIPTYIRIEICEDNFKVEREESKYILSFNRENDVPKIKLSSYQHTCILNVYSTKENNEVETDYIFTPCVFVENITLNEFINSAKMHTLYLNDELSLLYIFSDTVGEYSNPNEWKNIRKRGIGGMFIIVQKKIFNSPFFEEEFVKIIKQITDKVANRIIQFYQLYNIEKHAVRAAISQVMARNMSHNIGSHVLSKMVGFEFAKQKFPLNDQYKSSFENIYACLKPNDAEKADFNLANFNSYLRTRMDFLADIATGEPSMETTNLLVRDIIGEMDKNRILLNNISGVENFDYTIKVKDCRECYDECCDKPACYCNSNNKDIPVSIPNGIMGYHALYVIIENIIRNTAKHQENSSPEHLTQEKLSILKEFTIEIRNSKHDDTLYEAWLYDSIDKSGVKELTKDEKDFFKDKTGIEYNDSFNTKLDWLVFEQNARLNNSVINSETSRLREGAWGLIEMDASAAYLRKLAPEKIDQDIYSIDLLDSGSRYNPQKNKLNILKAINKNGHLGYRFHLLKPKEMLIVDETDELYFYLNNVNGKSKFDILRENGIWVVQTKNQDKDYFDIEKVYAHPFMLIIAGDDFNVNKYLFVKGDETDLFRGNLPNKIIVCKTEKKCEKKAETTPWVANIDCENELTTALRNPTSENLTRVQLNVETDGKSFEELLSKNTIMDLVWKVWLENKMEFRDTGISKASLAEILPYIYSNKDNISTHFALHGEVDVANRFNPPAPIPGLYPNNKNNRFKSDYFLAYPSSTKEFMDNASNKMINPEGSYIQNIYVNKIYSAILAESILNKILIIDERVQSSWESNYSSTNVKKNKLYKDCGMYCPNPNEDEKIDLNKPTFNAKYKVDILEFIAAIENNNKLKGLDFIVIHLGVIEKILTINNGPKEKTNVREFILEIQNCLSNKTRVVITSGRGKPDNLPDEVPFISFSTLSQYSIETPFKPLLSQVIQRARIFKTH